MGRILLLSLLVVMALSGCRLHVIALQGGQVSVGGFNCLTQTSCVYNVDDTSFQRTFTASASPGYQFVKWHGGDDFLCANSTNPTCVIDTTPLAGLVPDAVFAILGDAYIMPIFSDRVPITDTIIVEGREWAQVDLFADVSWDSVDAVCPAANDGVCDGSLNAWNVTGWTWAHLEDVNRLFNVYISPVVLGPFSPDSHTEADSLWAPAFFAAGWRIFSGPSAGILQGWTRIQSDSSNGFLGYLDPGLDEDRVGTDRTFGKSGSSGNLGVWLYRDL